MHLTNLFQNSYASKEREGNWNGITELSNTLDPDAYIKSSKRDLAEINAVPYVWRFPSQEALG
jgi:hypothetical protein